MTTGRSGGIYEQTIVLFCVGLIQFECKCTEGVWSGPPFIGLYANCTIRLLTSTGCAIPKQ